MLFLIIFLYAVIWFFHAKMIYTSSHFTGASKALPVVYLAVGFVSLAFELFILYRIIVRYNFWWALLCFAVGLVAQFVLTSLITHAVYSAEKRIDDSLVSDMLWNMRASRQCDVVNAYISAFGLFVNPVCCVLLAVMLK